MGTTGDRATSAAGGTAAARRREYEQAREAERRRALERLLLTAATGILFAMMVGRAVIAPLTVWRAVSAVIREPAGAAGQR